MATIDMPPGMRWGTDPRGFVSEVVAAGLARAEIDDGEEDDDLLCVSQRKVVATAAVKQSGIRQPGIAVGHARHRFMSPLR